MLKFTFHPKGIESIFQYFCIDWLNKNHFDYRGLIEKGLAIDVTGTDIYDVPEE